MAHTEHLPIYKGCYDLCLYLEQVVHNFPRYQKYTLGTDLRDGARRALRLVVRANARRDKAAVLLELREQLEELKVLLRLGQDVKAFANFNDTTGSFTTASLDTPNSSTGFYYNIDDITTAVVPLPGAFWLFGSGLAGLIAVRRRRK